MPERLFGTNGVRGVVNEDLTPEFALQMGKAIGKAMGGTIAIATDTRTSAHLIKTAVSSGIMAVGANILDLGVLPTPALQYYIKTHKNISGGVMITASHNPPMFNGIKCIMQDGTEADHKDEDKIEALFRKKIQGVSWESAGTMEFIRGAGEDYVNSIISKVDAEAIRKANLKVCLDCANGAACETSPLLLKKLNVATATINSFPEGRSPGRPSEPTEENLKETLALTRTSGADLGIAHDGDADRCVFITSEGEYVSGDKALALLSKYILLKKKGLVVTTVSTSAVVEDTVREAGGEIEFTEVGAPVVARKMIERKNAVFGGEENGGLIFPEEQYCRDGGMAIAMMLEYIVKEGPLKTQVSKLPVYYTVKKKIECPNEMKKIVLDHIIKESSGGRIDRTDGIKVIFDDGWILARPSGTEPLFRIFSESKNQKTANDRADKYERMVKERLKKGLT